MYEIYLFIAFQFLQKISMHRLMPFLIFLNIDCFECILYYVKGTRLICDLEYGCFYQILFEERKMIFVFVFLQIQTIASAFTTLY